MAIKAFSKLKEFFKPTADLNIGPWSVGKDFHVVYSPFPAIEGVRKLGTSWEPHSKYIVVRHEDMPEALGFVKNSQKLYIVCHCNRNATTVADNANNRLTAAELAARIEEDGLSKRIRRIYLYACSGGAGGVNSFASQFALEMMLLQYLSCEFYAYISTVTSLDPKTGQKYALDLDENGDPIKGTRVRASCMKIKV